MAPDPRAAKAVRAMRELGFPDKRTKPVLKRLYRLYDRNWEPIEEEDYRVLIDGIFESEELEAAEQKKNLDDADAAKRIEAEQAESMKATEEEKQIPGELVKPLKRERLSNQDDEASPSCIKPNTISSESLLKKPKLEINEVPESQPKHQSPAQITVTGPVPRTDPQPVSPPPLKPDRNNGKQVISPMCLTNPKDTSTENNWVKELDPTKTMNFSNHVQQTSSGRNRSTAILDIASSSSGEVKISLRYKSDKGNPRFSFESEDSVLKTLEDKCQKAYKFLDPSFSLKKLMKDICEWCLEIGSDHSGEPTEKNTHVVPPTDSLNPGNGSEKTTENGLERNNHSFLYEIRDIAKGQESVIISLVNEVNTECRPSFHYIPRNAVFQKAYVNFSLMLITNENSCSTCTDNCLTSSTPPCRCALQTGGGFAYSNEGTIRQDLFDEYVSATRDPKKYHLSYCKECPLEKPKNEVVLGICKGHLARSFIKECWLKCGCSKNCGNRVVQGGIRYKLQVFMTPGSKGWGLRVLEDLPKGAFVCEFVGEVLTCEELHNRISQSCKKEEYAYPIFLDADWGEETELQKDEALCLDAKNYGNVARFINHRCFDANLIEIPVEIENPDRHYYHIAFFTTRKVKALEELTRDYGIDFDDNDDPLKAFECKCGSQFCRNIKGSSGSKKSQV